MFNPEKIEEWIREVQERPTSAPLIIQFLADRLRDLNDWNQKLRAENLEIRSGARLEVYERQIAHLEYQLELLKRQVGGEIPLEAMVEVASPAVGALNLLVYGPQGQVLRLDLDTDHLVDDQTICHLEGLEPLEGEPPRLMITSSMEELMFIFTSGRIFTSPIHAIPLAEETGTHINWQSIGIPEEPKLGETLACVIPISKIALADFFLQVSRRGYLKKIRKALAPTIMESKYIGTGVKVPADQTLTLVMSCESESYALVSYEGYLQVIPETLLPHAIVEAMRLGKTDHLVAAFPIGISQSILVMTQIGKIIHRSGESLEAATDLQRKGSMLYTTARRDAGVRVVGAAPAEPDDWGVALHANGQLSLHAVSDLLARGAVPIETALIDFVTFTPLKKFEGPQSNFIR